jgi:NAD(P)-dependent dehydrogenase (short-subunit alcohol dehydrogenase family)
MGPGMSGYNASKIAQIKVMEYLAAEQPAMFVASVHPGICDTAVLAKSGAKPDQVPLDQSKPNLLDKTRRASQFITCSFADANVLVRVHSRTPR